jgi:hypothetical protein
MKIVESATVDFELLPLTQTWRWERTNESLSAKLIVYLGIFLSSKIKNETTNVKTT